MFSLVYCIPADGNDAISLPLHRFHIFITFSFSAWYGTETHQIKAHRQRVKHRVSWVRGWRHGLVGVVTGGSCHHLWPMCEGWILRLTRSHEGLGNTQSNRTSQEVPSGKMEYGWFTCACSPIEFICPQAKPWEELSNVYFLHDSQAHSYSMKHPCLLLITPAV